MDENYRKINESEMLIGGVFLLGLDSLCALLDFFTAGFIEPATITIQGFINFWMMQWFKSKGGDTGKLGQQILKYVCAGRES